MEVKDIISEILHLQRAYERNGADSSQYEGYNGGFKDAYSRAASDLEDLLQRIEK
jgi:hypothetical protein